MLKTSSKPFPELIRSQQINDYYCGPAVLQMLLSYQSIVVDQQEINRSIGTEEKIKAYGMVPEELGWAVKIVAPLMQLWFKRNATIAELSKIVNVYHQPVGVEWQGLFEYEEEGEDTDDDLGHYGVITQINIKDNIVKMADPYKHYAGKDRRFTILQFERRWWDINMVIDPQTKQNKEVDDYHVMFIVVPKLLTFPEKLGMKRG